MAVIRRRHIIQNASNLYNFTNDNLQLPLAGVSLSRRVFRPHCQFKEIKGNRAIHSIFARSWGQHLEIKDLSCYCEQCLIDDYDHCVNTAHVNTWEEQILELEAPERRATCADVSKIREGIVDLITKDSTVAIVSGDASADYYMYLLRVLLDQPEILESPVKDAWNAHYPTGADIICGFFYQRVNYDSSSPNLYYQLISDKIAYVYATTVRFICSDLQEC